MEAFSFGSYYAGRSFIHRLDPRTKLLAGFGFLFIALASHTFPALAVLAIGIGISHSLPSLHSSPNRAVGSFFIWASSRLARASSIHAVLSHAACF